MTEKLPDNPEIEPLTRTQVLVAMGVTAIANSTSGTAITLHIWLVIPRLAIAPLTTRTGTYPVRFRPAQRVRKLEFVSARRSAASPTPWTPWPGS